MRDDVGRRRSLNTRSEGQARSDIEKSEPCEDRACSASSVSPKVVQSTPARVSMSHRARAHIVLQMSILRTLAALSAFLLLPKCDSGYPIAPTLCDDLCAAQDRIHCENDLDPATCVARCEGERQTDSDQPFVGESTRCDYSRSELLACVRALPDSVFSCVNGTKRLPASACADAELHLAICRAQDTRTWEDLCWSWARRCDRMGGGDGGATQDAMYRACLAPYRYARGCSGEQRGFVECLLGRELSCETIPSLEESGCQAERSAIDACDPRMNSICLLWAFECTARAADAGTDVAGADPADPSRHSVLACLTDRVPDVRPRCIREREGLYNCLSESWYEDHVVRCDVTPARGRECAWERGKLEACVMSSDAGVN